MRAKRVMKKVGCECFAEGDWIWAFSSGKRSTKNLKNPVNPV